jgi:hypothetical protein
MSFFEYELESCAARCAEQAAASAPAATNIHPLRM